MSLLHETMFRMMYEGKEGYDSDNPPDYVARREQGKARPVYKKRTITVKKYNKNGVQGEFLMNSRNPSEDIILCIHGGGFVAGTAQESRRLTTWLVEKSGYNVYAADYRLAPEYPFPQGANDCLEAYRMLLENYDADHICLLGDSAGGNLVLSVVLQAQDAGFPLPKCVVAISPCVQFDRQYPSFDENEKSDCMLCSNFIQEVKEIYLQSKPEYLKHPYAAPLYGDVSNFPPTYITVSDSECLYDDAREMAKVLKAAGRECTLDVYHGLMHVFPTIVIFPESKIALRKIKDFMDCQFGRS